MPVTYERRGDIGFVTIARGDALNAMDRTMYADANRAFRSFLDDDEASVAILHSTCAEAFSAGVDIKDVHRALAEEKLAIDELREHFSLFFEAPGAVPKPVIAAIHGHCVGEGLVMSLFCDLRIAADDATFSLPEAKIGVPAINGTIRAVQMIGYGAAMELLLTGETRDVEWARRVGLVNEVVERAELMPRAEKLARRIADNDPAACRIMLELGERALEQNFAELVKAGGAMRNNMTADSMIERQGSFVDKKRS